MASLLLPCRPSPHRVTFINYKLQCHYLRKPLSAFPTALGKKSKLSIVAYERVTFKLIIVQTKMKH